LGLLVAGVGHWRGLSWLLALCIGGALVLIGFVTLPSGLGAPHLLDDAGARLHACLTTRSDWLPTGEYWDGGTTVIVVQTVANVALYAPLGMGVALLNTRPRWLLAVAPPLLLSMVIETFQAMFTARVCAPIDVISNALGGVLGFALCGLLLVVARAHHPDHADHAA
ncbi:MAG: VanZ family protein, partial [Lapillicoccus sp.]